MNNITFHINPDSLLFHIVSTTPGTESLTHLDRLVLSGLLLFVDTEGKVRLLQKERKHLMKGLDLSAQGLANVITRLIAAQVITRLKDRGTYQLTGQFRIWIDLPKMAPGNFGIQFVTNKQ